MASYRGHLMLAAPLGVGYAALPLLRPEFDWGLSLLGATLTTIGGLMPDLDSDSGVPVRELFSLASTVAAVAVFKPLQDAGFNVPQTLSMLIVAYSLMRYVVAGVFRRVTVHRGMFHSIPAMLVSGLIVYLSYPVPDFVAKCYLAGGMMLGFLSHLILDELFAFDFNGVRFKANQFAGTAMKFGSPSWSATLFCYVLLIGLGYIAYNNGLPEWARDPSKWHLPASVPSPSTPR